ncbi:hypothetical protein [Gemmatimonas sp.]|uniref:hypothetical protein n=1 Tax=Gemmatimonas sp. TaxID=1962908 RepID=UPI003983BA50
MAEHDRALAHIYGMIELAALSTPALHAIKLRLTNWLVYIAALDLLVVLVLAYLFTTQPLARVMPFVPILTLPAIALFPVLRRVHAVKKELSQRGE